MAAILDFLKNSKTAQNQLEIDQNIENDSNLFKLSISMEKVEEKCILRNFTLKLSKVGFEKVVAMATA